MLFFQILIIISKKMFYDSYIGKISTLVAMSLMCNVFASLEPDHSVINSS